MAESCPKCFHYLQNSKCPNCGYELEIDDVEESKKEKPFVYNFILFIILIQITLGSFVYGFWYATIEVLFTWATALLIPFILIKSKIKLSKKISISIAITLIIFLFIINCIVDLYFKSLGETKTTSIYNIFHFLAIYYLMTDNPMFSFEKKNKSKKCKKEEERMTY